MVSDDDSEPEEVVYKKVKKSKKSKKEKVEDFEDGFDRMERERREDLEERDAFAQRVIKRDKEKQIVIHTELALISAKLMRNNVHSPQFPQISREGR